MTATLEEWQSLSLFLQSNLLRVYLVDVDSHGNRCHPVPPPIKTKKGEGEIVEVNYLATYLNQMNLT